MPTSLDEGTRNFVPTIHHRNAVMWSGPNRCRNCSAWRAAKKN